MQGAAGNASGDPVYVEDVFATHLYNGTSGTSLAINNGIDLAGEGGLVWIKERSSGGGGHILFSTDSSGNHSGLLVSSSSAAAGTGYQPTYFTQNNNGFTTTNTVGDSKTDGNEYASFSFREKAGFFSIVSWTGDGSGDQTISHNLASTPGFIAVKALNADSSWRVFHTSTGNTKFGYLNSTSDISAMADLNWNATSTTFVADSQISLNTNGRTYVAYLWASGTDSASQIFGDDGDESIVRCGSYTGDGGAGTTEVNLGFEPQWILVKATSAADNWFIIDNMRGWATDNNANNDAYLMPNASNAESTGGFLDITSTGFKTTLYSNVNVSGRTYAYLAIRRGPMKEPSAGTDVLDIRTSTSSGSPEFLWNSLPFPPDWAGYRAPVDNGYAFQNSARLIQGKSLATRNTDSASTSSNMYFDSQDAWFAWGSSGLTGYFSFAWRRYPKVFDMLVMTGTGSAQVVNHNLTVVPELMISKTLAATGYTAGGTLLDNWFVWSSHVHATNSFGFLNTDGTDAYSMMNQTPTATQLTLQSNVAYSGDKSVKFLFATLAGVSKVGTVVHSGTTNVDCGFSSGARFVMIKRTDASSDWFVFDSVMGGIVAGNDQYFRMNVGAAPVTGTDYIDPLAAGFTLTSSFTAGTYFFLAFA